jgi:hypothetical protein
MAGTTSFVQLKVIVPDVGDVLKDVRIVYWKQ